MTKVKDLFDTVRRLTVKAISVDLHMFKLTAQKNYHFEENLPMSKSILHCLVPNNAYCL